MNAGAVMTHMADSVITDSAAAATAFACGYKTSDGFLGVYPREEELLSVFEDFDPDRAYAPLASILEAAKARGKATGLVATSRITHATPAAFASHTYSRNEESSTIMEHLVYNGLTVSLGGGRGHLLPANSCPNAAGGNRADCENLEKVLLDRGYDFVTTKDEMDAVPVKRKTKLWGAFAPSHMDSDIDRRYLELEEPSLAEMTAKAIEVLRQNKEGFFMMVEGSQVDWAGHANDSIYMITDFLAFDDAVKVAVDFAEEDGDTLVVAFPDHNTGGMKIGNYYTVYNAIGKSYTNTQVEDLIDPLVGMQVTAGLLVSKLDDYGDDLIAAVEDLWGLEITEDDVDEIDALASEVGKEYAIARIISKNHTVIGWTTHGHNGEDVPVWIYPASAAIGVIDDTELPTIGQAGDLDALTARLFIEVDDVFDDWSLDKTDPQNYVLKVNGAELPINKDVAICKGKEHQLGSLVVYAPTRSLNGDPIEDRVYIPDEAISLINKCHGKKEEVK
jgi:alkaline phosphatase